MKNFVRVLVPLSTAVFAKPHVQLSVPQAPKSLFAALESIHLSLASRVDLGYLDISIIIEISPFPPSFAKRKPRQCCATYSLNFPNKFRVDSIHFPSTSTFSTESHSRRT
jgi:hypothetical protein